MKKLLKISVSLLLIILLCFQTVACGDDKEVDTTPLGEPEKTVSSLENESGVSIEGGDFSEGSVLKVTALESTAEKAEEIIDKIKNSGVAINDANKTYIYDISVTKENAKVQPNGSVTVSVPAPEGETAESYNVYHVKDSGAIESLPSSFADGKITFKTDGFSYYVFVPTDNIGEPQSENSATVKTGAIAHNMFTTEASIAINGVNSNTPNREYFVGQTVTFNLLGYPSHYRFLGWYELDDDNEHNQDLPEDMAPILKNAPLSTERRFDYEITSENVEIYAVFVDSSHTIYIDSSNPDAGAVTDANGEALELPFYDPFKVNKTYTLTATAKEGYEFVGWNIDSMYSAIFEDSATITCTTNLYSQGFFAEFKAITTDIYVDAIDTVYDPSLGEELPDFENAAVYAINADGSAKLNKSQYTVDLGGLDATKPGTYTVTYTYKENKEIKNTVSVTVLKESVTVTVEIDGRGGSANLLDENKVEKGSELALVATTQNENFVFLGWYLEADGSLLSTEAEYTYTANENATIIAKFKPKGLATVKTGAIAHNMFTTEASIAINGVNSNTPKREYFVGQTVTFNLSGYPSHYSFLGWYELDDDNEHNQDLPEDMAPILKNAPLSTERRFDYEITSENVEIYAVFVDSSHTIYIGSSNPDAGAVTDANGEALELPFYDPFKVNKTYTLTATANEGYKFVGWSINGMYSIRFEDSATISCTTNPYLYEIFAEFEPIVTGIELNKDSILYDPNMGMEIPSLDDVVVSAISAEGSTVLTKGLDYTVDLGGLDFNTPGEYTVTYTYTDNPEIFATLRVAVTAPYVSFSAYIDGGTLLLDGVDIGPDFYQSFSEGFGSVTLTAEPDDGAKFVGWYALDNSSDSAEPVLISSDATYTFSFNENTDVFAKTEYLPTALILDGMNASFDTYQAYTEIYDLDVGELYNVNQILVYALINGEQEILDASQYTLDAGGFDTSALAFGDYLLTFTHNEYPEIKATHLVRVLDEENMVSVSVDVEPGGRLTSEPLYSIYNKGEQIDLAVELRSEKEYEFLGWYKIVSGTSEATSSETLLSSAREFTYTLEDADTYIVAKIEPKVTYLTVEGYEGEPTKIHLDKFWLKDRIAEGGITVYACGALGREDLLDASGYTVDYGGLDLDNPEVGTYTVTYTYNEDTSITYSITVMVYNEDFSFSAVPDTSNNGELLFNDSITVEAGGQFIKGESVTITALPREGFEFVGWYTQGDPTGATATELVSLDATYTFAIEADTAIVARFREIIYGITLETPDFMMAENSQYLPSNVFLNTGLGSTQLSEGDYTIDFGDYNKDALSAGTYVFTYTYKPDENGPEFTATQRVMVTKPTYLVTIYGEGGTVEVDGYEFYQNSLHITEGNTFVIKAKTPDSGNIFKGWYMMNANGEFTIYSTEETLALTVNNGIEIKAIYDSPVKRLILNYKSETSTSTLFDQGVEYFDVEAASQSYYDEEIGGYATYVGLTLKDTSLYIGNFASLFDNFRIIAQHENGSYKEISASELSIDFGDYTFSNYSWEIIKVSYCGFTMLIDTYVTPANN